MGLYQALYVSTQSLVTDTCVVKITSPLVRIDDRQHVVKYFTFVHGDTLQSGSIPGASQLLCENERRDSPKILKDFDFFQPYQLPWESKTREFLGDLKPAYSPRISFSSHARA